jgi:hypothetical protein
MGGKESRYSLSLVATQDRGTSHSMHGQIMNPIRQ